MSGTDQIHKSSASSYRLSFAQQEALRNVGRCGSPRVRWAHTNRRTTANLRERGFVAFDDARGLFKLTERGTACLRANGYTPDGMAAWPSPSMPVPSADHETKRSNP